MQYSYFPVQLDELGAEIRSMSWSKGPFGLLMSRLEPATSNHPALTFGYRLEAEGAAIIYASDHEPHSRHLADGTGEIGGEDLRHCEFLSDADLVSVTPILELAEEYPQRIGWGHGAGEYAFLALCCAGRRIKRIALARVTTRPVMMMRSIV